MVSSAGSGSDHGDTSSAAWPVGPATETEGVDAIVNEDEDAVVLDENEALEAREETALVNLCICVREVVNLVWHNRRASNGEDQRRIYANFSIDPGNVSESTNAFSGTSKCIDQSVRLLLPLSLTAESSGALFVVELWEIRSEVHHELTGHSRRSVHQIVGDSSAVHELVLTRKRGRTPCGKIRFSATLDAPSNVLAPALFQHGLETREYLETEKLQHGCFHVMALECRGLQEACDSACISCRDGCSKGWLHSDSESYDQEHGAFIWNHWFRFESTVSAMKDGAIVLQVNGEASQSDDGQANMLAFATLEFSSWPQDSGVFCAWIPVRENHNGTEALSDARIRVACCFVLEEGFARAETELVLAGENSDQISPGSAVQSTSVAKLHDVESPPVMSLGSLVEIRVTKVCALAPETVRRLNPMTTTEYESTQELSVHGLLLLGGKASQRNVLAASVSVETTHCIDHQCATLCTKDGDQVILRFGLGPDVTAARLPHVRIELRAKRPQMWRFSVRLALPALLRQLSTGTQCQLRCPLLDPEDIIGGWLEANFRCGQRDALERYDRPWVAVTHIPEARSITVQVTDLQVCSEAKNESNNFRCFANVWSSSTGKHQAQTVSPLTWETTSQTDRPQERSCVVSLFAHDIATEVIFVAIHRFSAHERNEQVAFGCFGLCALATPGVGGSDDVAMEHHVQLYSSADPASDLECGSMRLTLRLSRVAFVNPQIDRSSSFATTELGEVAYPVQACEMLCRLDVSIVKARDLPPFISEGDTVIVSLRIAQSRWQKELTSARISTSCDNSEKVVSFGENVHAIIRWSPKDRVIPTLEISMRGRCQMKPQRKSTIRRPFIASVARRKFSDNVHSQGTNSTNSPEEKPIAVGSMSLCPFFSLPNAWVCSEVQMGPAGRSGITKHAALSDESSTTSLLVKTRLSSVQDSNAGEPPAPESGDPAMDVINGNVCIHLLHASGSFLGKANSLSKFYVSMGVSSEVAISSSRAVSDSRTITWNEHLTLLVQHSAPPIVRLFVCRRSIVSPDPAKPPNFHTTRSQMTRDDDDEVVGVLSVPVFPSITQRNHLVHFDLPFDAPQCRTAQQSDGRVKQGTLSFEMQFLESQTSVVPKATVRPSVELVIHQLRGGIRDPNTGAACPMGLSKHVLFDVALMTEINGKETYQTVGMTNVISLSGSGVTEIGEVVNLSKIADGAMQGISSPAVLLVKILDLDEKVCGRVHVPLRSDWKQRLGRNKKHTWYSIHDDTGAELVGEGNKKSVPALLMSIRVDEYPSAEPLNEAVGRLYVKVEEAIPYSTGSERSKLFRGSTESRATVVLTSRAVPGISAEVKHRTRRSICCDGDDSWRWLDEWFAVDNPSNDVNASQQLHICLAAGDGSKSGQRQFASDIDLFANMEDATLGLVDRWIVLRELMGKEESTEVVHLHLALVYVPTLAGTISMEFTDARAFSESELSALVETTFFKCDFCKKVYVTPAVAVDDEHSDEPEGSREHSSSELQMPVDSRMAKVSGGPPSFVVRWMGVIKSLGEICLGECDVSLLAVMDTHKVPAARRTEDVYSHCKWYTLTEKGDRSRKTGVVRLSTTFKQTTNCLQKQLGGRNAVPREHQVASAEVLAVWKKLFYMLDENANGYIDHGEFVKVFTQHLDGMLATSDGLHLVRILFGERNQDEGGAQLPTAQDVQALFSEMDLNCDNKIEWKEYIQLIQRKQQLHHIPTLDAQEEVAQPSPRPELTSPQPAQMKELRRKKREDTSAALSRLAGHSGLSPSSTGVQTAGIESSRPLLHLTSGSNQSLSPRAEVLAVQEVLKAKSASKRQSIPSSENGRPQLFLSKQMLSSEEQQRLQQQVASLESLLAIERQRFAELAADRQALLRSYQNLHLKHQSGIIQEQTKTKWMERTIERQQQLLEERESHRRRLHGASVVLQSTVRSRLEQRRFQSRKLQRANAATTIQCLTRQVFATRQLRVLQKADREAKRRAKAATKLQRFARYHMARKERNLLVEAREVSAVILQKYARRLVATRSWKRQRLSALKLQCWTRQRLAVQRLNLLRDSTFAMKAMVRVWASRWQYQRTKSTSLRLQRWWRQARQERSAFLQCVEAAICIQSVGRRYLARKQFERKQERQEAFLAEFEAAVCIQATWRGKYERLISPRAAVDFSEDEADHTKALVPVEKDFGLESERLKPASRCSTSSARQDEQQSQAYSAPMGPSSAGGNSMYGESDNDDEAAVEVAKVLAGMIDRFKEQPVDLDHTGSGEQETVDSSVPLAKFQPPLNFLTEVDDERLPTSLQRESLSASETEMPLFEAGGADSGDTKEPPNEPRDCASCNFAGNSTDVELQTEVMGLLEHIVTVVLRTTESACDIDESGLHRDFERLGASEERTGESGDDETDQVTHQGNTEALADVEPSARCTANESSDCSADEVPPTDTLEGQYENLLGSTNPTDDIAHSIITTSALADEAISEPPHDACESDKFDRSSIAVTVATILEEVKERVMAGLSDGDSFDHHGLAFNGDTQLPHGVFGLPKTSAEMTGEPAAASLQLDCGSGGEVLLVAQPGNPLSNDSEPLGTIVAGDDAILPIDPEKYSGSSVGPASSSASSVRGDEDGGSQSQIEASAAESMALVQLESETDIVKPSSRNYNLNPDTGAESSVEVEDEERQNDEVANQSRSDDESDTEGTRLTTHSADETLAPMDTNVISGRLRPVAATPAPEESLHSDDQSVDLDMAPREQHDNKSTITTETDAEADAATVVLTSDGLTSEISREVANLGDSTGVEDWESGVPTSSEGDSALPAETEEINDEKESATDSSQPSMVSSSTEVDRDSSKESVGRTDPSTNRPSDSKASVAEVIFTRDRSSTKQSHLEGGTNSGDNDNSSGGDDGDDDDDSMDSDDLMWEADAMAELDGNGRAITSTEPFKHSRRREGRRDSLKLLADSRLLKAQGDISTVPASADDNHSATGNGDIEVPHPATFH